MLNILERQDTRISKTYQQVMREYKSESDGRFEIMVKLMSTNDRFAEVIAEAQEFIVHQRAALQRPLV